MSAGTAPRVDSALRPDSFPPPDAVLENLLRTGVAHGFPGLAVWIESPDGRVRAAAAGSSDLLRSTPLRIDDAFHLASVTKAFTAVAVLRLVDEGKLSLEATIADLLGAEVAALPHAERITVAQLLDHSSGLNATNNDPDYLATVIGLQADPARVWTPAEMIALAAKGEPAGLPGTGHHYSDTSYVLLGRIVERVSGRPFQRYVAETLFVPLGLRSTWFYSGFVVPGHAPPPRETVRGYLLATPELRQVIAIHPGFLLVPGVVRVEGELLDTTLAAERLDTAGGIVSTLPDLARFASALFRGRLLSPASQRFLLAVGEGMESEPLGKTRIRTLEAVRKPHGLVLFKSGDGPGGVNTLMAYRPGTGEIVLGFTNVFGVGGELDFFLDELMK